MRFNEVSAIKCKDVTFHDNHMLIHIAKSKTDQYREGNNVLINGGVTAACLVTMLKRYIGNAKIEPTSDHFLFKPMYTNKGRRILINKNKPLSYTRTRETVVSRLKEVCGDSNIGLHSLRAGGASTATRAPVNERCWKRHGRRKSDLSKDGYIRDSVENRLEVTKQIKL